MHKTMRHILAGSGAMVAVAVLGAFLIMYGRSGTTAPQPAAGGAAQTKTTEVPFTEITRGLNSKVTERKNYLVTSSVELKSLWKLLNALGTPPKIDFNKNAVLAVFAGQQPTAGYTISVTKVEDAETRIVSITVARPGNNCMTGQTLIAPYDVVTVPATSLSFSHKDIQTIQDCR